MVHPLHLDRPTRGHRSDWIMRGCWFTWLTMARLMLVSSAAAQYGYDPAANGRNAPGIHYFGSVQDDQGAFLPGATITLDGERGRYVFVTDEQGRFRGNLPTDMPPGKVSPRCFKVGFELVRVTKRPGPAGGKAAVQVDCVLREGRTG
jgi:hypothetical protein